MILQKSNLICTFLVRAPDCDKFVTFCSHFFWRCGRSFVSGRIGATTALPNSQVLHMRNIKWQTKQKCNENALLITTRTVYQLKPVQKMVLAQNSFTREPELISQHSTALRDPARSNWTRCKMNKDCCEIKWESFKFCTEFSVMNRSNGADIENQKQ